MERAAVPRRLTWQACEVVDVRDDTPTVRSLMLKPPERMVFLPGQHVDVRLTAEDGYQAERSYSIASAPEDDLLELTVERLDDGEVSPYLVGELRRGDQLELRGPIGEYFVWTAKLGGPVLLVAGGSGVVPFRSMLRHHAAKQSSAPVRLLYSARTLRGVIYRDELETLGKSDSIDVRLTLTRESSPEWTGLKRRVDDDMLRDVEWPVAERPHIYVCGPTPFVEHVADAFVRLGHEPARIKTERFGPTGM